MISSTGDPAGAVTLSVDNGVPTSQNLEPVYGSSPLQATTTFTLTTQNVDGLHQRAGSGKRFPVIELHGNIQRTKCSRENRLVQDWAETGEILPRCPYCDSLLRPDVVWFGEMLPQDVLRAAREAAQECEVFFSIGTSSLVEPAASLPFLALEAGGCIIEINPNPTPLTSQASYTLSGPAGVVLPALVQAVWGDVNHP